MILIPQIHSLKKSKFTLNYASIVVLNISGTGSDKVLINDSEVPLPNRIIINNGSIIYNYSNIWEQFNFSEINIVRMEWDNQLTTCKYMFKSVKNLISIDFSEFDFSQVTDMTSLCESCELVKSINMRNGNGLRVKIMDRMFAECHNLVSLDITGFKTSSELTSMVSLFYGCYKLESIDLSSFVTTSVTSMFELFKSCRSIKSLDLSNFCTPALTNMHWLFENCFSLEYVNISCFNTSKITCIGMLFKNCYNLKYIDLRNFDTSKVNDMAEMFMNCYRLTSVELSSFNTRSTTNMGHMFTDCHSLISLNLSNFNTNVIKHIDFMFYNCYSLRYLDITNLNAKNIINYEQMFFNTSSLISLNLTNFESVNISTMISQINKDIVLCFNEAKVPDTFITQANAYINNCSLMCDMQNRIFINEINYCAISCYTSGTGYTYQYTGKCYLTCPEGTKFYNDTKLCEDCRDYYTLDKKGCLDSIPDGYYNDDSAAKTIKKCPNECQNCTLDSLNSGLCLSCYVNDQYYPKINDSLNTDSYYKCYNKNETQINYYLDNNIFKPCYPLCNKCSGEGNNENNNCTECKDPDYELVDGNCICINYYNYEKTECISIIPDGYYNNNHTGKTIDKCPSKCSNCSYDSIVVNNDLCVSCNINGGYFPKEDDPHNINSFYECYQENQTYYYLDHNSNIFKHCYSSCKTCSGVGNDEHNLCIECNNSTLKVLEGNCVYVDNSISEIIEEDIEKDIEKDTDIITYKNSNKTELLRDLINELLNRINISDLKEGNIKTNISEKIFLEFGSLDYDDINENISINIGQCENILKDL